MPIQLKDDDGFPTICEVVYATCVPDDLGRLGIIYWARCGEYSDSALKVLEWDLAYFSADIWSNISERVSELRQQCGARQPPSVVAFVEGETLATQANARGCLAVPIPTHLTTPEAWQGLATVAASHLAEKNVRLTVSAWAKANNEAWANANARPLGFVGLPRMHPGPRGDDPIVPAWLYGVALGLDPASARPPQPAKVKVVR